MASCSGQAVLPDSRPARTQCDSYCGAGAAVPNGTDHPEPTSMHPPRPGRWNRLTFEQRTYVAVLLLGLLLNLWAGLAALQAQGRFPQLSFDLLNMDDLALPGRPVLRPVLDPGDLRTYISAAATQGRLIAYLDDVTAEVDIAAPGISPPVNSCCRRTCPDYLRPTRQSLIFRRCGW